MDRFRTNISEPSNESPFEFSENNFFVFDDEFYDLGLSADGDENNILEIREDIGVGINLSQNSEFKQTNSIKEKEPIYVPNKYIIYRNFALEDEMFRRFVHSKYLKNNSLFVLVGKNDFLYIGVFFLIIAIFLLGDLIYNFS